MPSSTIVRAAIFAAGAIVGGCVATAVTNNRNKPAPQFPRPVPPQPVVGLDATGKTTISTELTITSNIPPVLKYGNPGELRPSNF